MAGCSIAGCPHRAAYSGWCRTHITRWRRHGDPLVLLPRYRGGARDAAGRFVRLRSERKPPLRMPRGALERSILISILLNERYDAARIARELGTACSTVRRKMAGLYRKCRINSRTHVPHVRLVYLLIHKRFEF